MLINCTNCGKEFDKLAREMRGSKNHFCSRSCAAQTNNRLYPKRSVEGFCHTCTMPISKSRKFCKRCFMGSKKLKPPPRRKELAHHTKDKGDLGLYSVILDLARNGIRVALPTSEHLPFDCLAISPDLSQIVKVSVKHRKVRKGVISVGLSSNWADRNGSHKKLPQEGSVDILALYCPDTDKCYYLKIADIGNSVSLRVVPPKNVSHYYRNAEDFCDPLTMF